jgi:hypothetical protein
LIPQLDNVIKVIRKYVAQQNPDVPGEWKLDFHVYGRDKPQTQQDGHPGGIFVIAEVVAPTQELATSICCSARAGMIVSFDSWNPLPAWRIAMLTMLVACSVCWPEGDGW